MIGPRTAAILLGALACAGCGAPERTNPDPFTASGKLIALSGGDGGARNACITCHGLDGGGNGAGVPRLAGLDTGYMARQLDNYETGRRSHEQMAWIAQRLDERDRLTVSAFYATLPPTSNEGPTVPAHPLYALGDPERGLASCASCHGSAGQGGGAAIPPLAGQPAAYLAAQLEAWRAGERHGPAGDVMRRISQRLTPAEVVQVSAFASQLSGDPRRPGSPAAFRSERRAYPRNDASAPPRRAGPPGPPTPQRDRNEWRPHTP